MTPVRVRLLAVLLLVAARLAIAQPAPTQLPVAPGPMAAPQPDKTVRDPEFGVAARHFGLERRVEMYQWQAAGDAYARVWSEQPVDSGGFSRGHENPPFPLQGQRWQAAAVSVDGFPLDPEVLGTLGQWRSFRPSFNALPGNLAATFQPQGDGLGSAENPLAPQIGDLRITWRDLVLPPLQDKVVLRDGRWRLKDPPPAAANDVEQVAPTRGDPPRPPSRLPWFLGAAVLLVLVLGWAVRRRRR